MKKMIESFNSFLEFFNNYPTWAKALMFSGIIITLITAVFSPRSTDKANSDKEEFVEIVDVIKKSEDFKAKLQLNKNLLPKYLKSKTAYDAIDYVYNLKINNETIDAVFFYHYNEQTQAVHYLILAKFYDIDTENVDWPLLNSEWDRFSNTVNYENLKIALANANGFNVPIEFQSPLGENNYKPKIIFTQICGRRSNLNSVDLAKMQEINSSTQEEIYRLPITYDFLLNGFNGIM